MPPIMLLMALAPAVGQPMGPWLDEALPAALDAPIVEVGACPDGYLPNGVQLKPSPGLYNIWFPDRVWGRQEMIDMITRASEEMAWLVPEADPIVIGDISTRWGGKLEGHMTHRGGIDVDISLYWDDARTIIGDYPGAHPDKIDVEVNWLLIRTMMDTGYIERILLDQRNIDRIKVYAVESGDLTPAEADRMFPARGSRDRFKIGVVHHAPNHQEHMHVRVLCRGDA